MIDVQLALRFAKHVAVLALAAGTLGTFVARDWADRQVFAYRIAGPGLIATWALGLAVAFVSEVSLLSSWILIAVVLSLASIQVVMWSAARKERRSARAAALALFLLAGALAAMVWKP